MHEADEHADTPSEAEGRHLWQQVYAKAVYLDFKAGLEHSANLWGFAATKIEWKIDDE